jgi:hypothetical protein
VRPCAAGALTVAVLGVTGCGGVDQRPATDTAQRFYAAVEHRDGKAACALLVGSTRSELEQSVLSVYLRQRGSPESKPVGAPHAQTGSTG